MSRISGFLVSAVFAGAVFAASVPRVIAQVKTYTPVTDEMLRNPSPNDWLMYSRTYDAFRDSPLKQINKGNVKNLRMAWVRGLEDGVTETIPIVHDGVMYVIAPGGIVDALDATNGDLIWEYKRAFKNPQLGSTERTKALAIYEDMVYFTAADGYVIALDARTGKVRWETYKTDTQNTSGALVVDGKVISGGTCGKEATVVSSRRITQRPVRNSGDSSPWRIPAIPAMRRGMALIIRNPWRPRGVCLAASTQFATCSIGA